MFKYVKGVKIAFISYTDVVNFTVPAEQSFCVNLINEDLIKKDIEQARSQNADIIVACMNWSSNQNNLIDFLFKNGVDIILGNSSQLSGPIEKRTFTTEDGSDKDGFVIYSLGNFMTSQNSIILNLKITKHVDTNKITIDNVDYIPLYLQQDNSLNTHRFKLLNIKKLVTDYETSINSGETPAISMTLYNNLNSQLQSIDNALK